MFAGVVLRREKPWERGKCKGPRICMLHQVSDGTPGIELVFPTGWCELNASEEPFAALARCRPQSVAGTPLSTAARVVLDECTCAVFLRALASTLHGTATDHAIDLLQSGTVCMMHLIGTDGSTHHHKESQSNQNRWDLTHGTRVLLHENSELAEQRVARLARLWLTVVKRGTEWSN